MHNLCYNVPSNEIDVKSILLIELFLDEWLNRSCIEPYEFTIAEKVKEKEVWVDIHCVSEKDAFYIKIKDISDILPSFKPVSDYF